MTNQPEEKTISLAMLRERILHTDLVPSRAVLVENIEVWFTRLQAAGIDGLSELKAAIKTPAQLLALSHKSGVPDQYLTLLRREIEGYQPKPFKLRDALVLTEEDIQLLQHEKIQTSADLYQEVISQNGVTSLHQRSGIAEGKLTYIFQLADLARVQWVSLNFAMWLVEAGYKSAQEVARANVDEMDTRLRNVNQSSKYFKGSIGLRDLNRLIYAAQFVA